MNHVCLMGRLTRDPELGTASGTGSPVASFTLAVERPVAKDGEGRRPADFIYCVAFERLATFIAQAFHKGQPMAVEGRLQTRSFQQEDGGRHTSTQVQVLRVDFCGARPEGGERAGGAAGA